MATIHRFFEKTDDLDLNSLRYLPYQGHLMIHAKILFNFGLNENGIVTKDLTDLSKLEIAITTFLMNPMRSVEVKRNGINYHMDVAPKLRHADIKWIFVQRKFLKGEYNPDVDGESSNIKRLASSVVFRGVENIFPVLDYKVDEENEVGAAVYIRPNDFPIIFYDPIYLFERKAIKRNTECPLFLSALALAIYSNEDDIDEESKEGNIEGTMSAYVNRIYCFLREETVCTIADSKVYRYKTSVVTGDDKVYFYIYIAEHMHDRVNVHEGSYLNTLVFLFGSATDF